MPTCSRASTGPHPSPHLTKVRARPLGGLDPYSPRRKHRPSPHVMALITSDCGGFAALAAGPRAVAEPAAEEAARVPDPPADRTPLGPGEDAAAQHVPQNDLFHALDGQYRLQLARCAPPDRVAHLLPQPF